MDHTTGAALAQDHRVPRLRPASGAHNVGRRLQAESWELGLSRKEAGRRLRIDENTLKAIEDGIRGPGQRCQEKLSHFLGS